MKGYASIAGLLLLGFAACSDDTATPPVGDQAIIRDLPSGGEVGPVLDLSRIDLPPQPVPDQGSGDQRALEASLPDAVLTPDGPASCGKVRCDCVAYSNKQGKFVSLWGKAQKLTSGFPDFKVKVVTFNGQLKVKTNTSFPTKCGEWQLVTGGLPTFSYQEVGLGEDFTIQEDQNFPGINQLACPACK